jgi:hypothetical protein
LQRHTVAPSRDGNARLSTRTTRLVPLAPEHLPGLRELELTEQTAFRWRHGGAHPSPSAFTVGAWADVLCSFLVVEAGIDVPRAIVSAYGADQVNGFCRIGAARFGNGPSPSFARGMFLFLDYLFDGWPFRKLYLEVPGFNLPQIKSFVDRFATIEATLPDHVYHADQYWDFHFVAINRTQWRAQAQARHPYLAR